MSTLNYQQPGEARREDWKRLKLRLFGPSRNDVWAQLAREIGGDVVDRGFWRGGKIVTARVEPWTITLDLTGDDKVVFTRLRAPYVNPDNFRFQVRRRNAFTGLAEALGFHDVQVGHPDFDHDFIIKGTSEPKLRQLFANPQLRRLLSAHESVQFQVRDDEGWFGKTFPQGVDELRLLTPGVIKDVERLKASFDLFAETLHTLCHIGSAYEDDPGLEL